MFKKVGIIVTLLSLYFGYGSAALGQEIKIDGDTATIVTKEGNEIIIDGNTLSSDGKNLFHSFQEFGLSAEQIATFLTNPNIQNILSRVTGGNPSYINGLIQVVGGNSNLFLMNPAGVIFGDGASLNVPADFTATTSTGIQFNDLVFEALGNNNYSELTGNPTGFIFNSESVGSIINTGNLQVAEGSNISLIGGNVINTGTIEAPQGKINIQAVNGGSTVKITPEGSLLSLEIDVPTDEEGNVLAITPQDLPTLLTGANNAGVATQGVAVNPDTGNVEVGVQGLNPVAIPNESGLNVVSGTLEASSSNAGDLGGEITLLGNKVAVIDAQIEADGANGGGEIKIGGDREGQGTIPNADFTYVSPESEITADAKVNGDGGEIIVFAEKFATIEGELTAKGGELSGDGGFIETSGKQGFDITSIPDTTAPNGTAGEWLIDPYNITIIDGDTAITTPALPPPSGPGGEIIINPAPGFNIDNPNPGEEEYTANTNDAQIGTTNLERGLESNNTVTISTGTDPEVGDQEGNITWESGATLDYDGNDIGTGKTLWLKAANNISYSGTIEDSDTATVNSLNVIFNSDADASGAGTISLSATNLRRDKKGFSSRPT